MKSSKQTKANPYVDTKLSTLHITRARERLVRAMKSEPMCHYCQYLLLSRSPEYIPYTVAEWNAFASRMKITREQLEFWVDKSLTIVLGKEWILARTKSLNKTFDPNLYPESMKAMWKIYMSTRVEPIVEESLANQFGKTYFCKVMDEKSWNISGILADPTIRSWRGKEKLHMYVWFLFEAIASEPCAKLLENHKLRRLFDALVCQDSSRNLLSAQSPVFLITDTIGFHDILCHLEEWREEVKVRVWSWQVITYSPGPKDGFPIFAIEVPCLVFLIFLFGYDEDQDAQSSFRNFFTGKAKTMKLTKVAEEWKISIRSSGDQRFLG